MKLLLCLMLCGSLSASAQILPTKDGKVFFEVIDSSLSQPKEDLFNKAQTWLINSFADAKQVLQLNDKESGELIGKGNALLYFSNILSTSEGRCKFSIHISCRDNKTRLQVYDVLIVNSAGEFPIEEYTSHPKSSKRLLEKIKSNMDDLIKSFTAAISAKKDNF